MTAPFPTVPAINNLRDAEIAINDLTEFIKRLRHEGVVSGILVDSNVERGAVLRLSGVGEWTKADASSAATAPVTGYGVAEARTVAGATVRVRMLGLTDGLSGLTPGAMHYLGSNGGLITDPSSVAVVVAIGVAKSASALLVQPQYLGDQGA